MGSLNNIFFIIIGINFIVVGLVACIAGIISLVKRDKPVKKLTSIVYIVAGVAAVCFGVVVLKS